MEQEQPKSKLSKRILIGVVVLFVLAIFLDMLFPGFGPKNLGYHLMSWTQMKQIALALNQYRQDHNGVAPRHFSELVPNYISTPKMFFMQSKYNTSTCVIPANLDSQPELIDIFSPYSFIVLPDQRILVSERPGVWMDNIMSYFLLDDRNQPTNIFEGFRACRVTPEEFQQRFSRGFQ